MKIVVAGGTGFIGRAVVDCFLTRGAEVIVLSRQPKGRVDSSNVKIKTAHWDAKNQGEWCAVLEGTDAIINFCGANISARPWTAEYKQILRQTRLDPVNALLSAIASCQCPPKAFINASAIGFYGNAGDVLLDETKARGEGFLAELCADWEHAVFQARNYGVRVVTPRMGIVLGAGGVLDKILPAFRRGLGGPLGSGRQWMSWITVDDLAETFYVMAQDQRFEGAVNCTAPMPVTMHDFCAALGSVLRRPSWLRCPAFVLKVLLGEMSDVVLGGQRAIPSKLLTAGFVFRYPSVHSALTEILKV
jgi:uncharacterized protein (TIGR01777 family)